MILADAVLLVSFHVQVDAQSEESGSLSGLLKDFAVKDALYGSLGVWDDLGQVVFPRVPASLTVVVAGQAGSHEPARSDRDGSLLGWPLFRRKGVQ